MKAKPSLLEYCRGAKEDGESKAPTDKPNLKGSAESMKPSRLQQHLLLPYLLSGKPVVSHPDVFPDSNIKKNSGTLMLLMA